MWTRVNLAPCLLLIVDCKPFVLAAVSLSRVQECKCERSSEYASAEKAKCKRNWHMHYSGFRASFSETKTTFGTTVVVLCQLLGLYLECFLRLFCLRTHSQTWRHRRQNERLTIAGHNKGTVQDSPLDTYTDTEFLGVHLFCSSVFCELRMYLLTFMSFNSSFF